VKSLGADEVIDYTKEDFAKNGQTYDIIFDAVMKTSFSRFKSSLKQRGIYLTVDWPILQALWNSMTSNKRIVFGIALARTEDLVLLRELIETGKIKVAVDKCYLLEQISEAHGYVEKGHKKGNVVITI